MKNPSTPITSLMLTALLAGAAGAQAADAPGSDATTPLLGIGLLQTAQSGADVPLPPLDYAAAENAGWTKISEPDGRTSYVKSENGSYLYWKGIPYVVAKYDLKTCASECPPALKQYAEKQPEKESGDKMSQMFSGDKTMFGKTGINSGEGKSAAPSPAQDPVDVAAKELGSGLGSQFFGDSGDGASGGLGEARDASSGEVGRAEVPALMDVHYTFLSVQKASDKAERIVDEVSRKLDPNASGRKDLDPNATPSKSIVVTPQ